MYEKLDYPGLPVESGVQPDTDNRFDNSYDAKAELSIGRHALRITDIRPLDIGIEECQTVPIVIAPGLLSGSEWMRPAIRRMVESGRRVVTVDHPRLLGSIGTAEVALPDYDIPGIEMRKAAILKAAIDARGLEEVDIVGHCEGALNGTVLALSNPDRVRSLLMLNPAGFVEYDDYPRMFGMMIRRTAKRLLSGNTPVASELPHSVSLFDTLRNPPIALPSIHAILRTRIAEPVSELHAKGVRVALLQSHSDPVFPPEILERHVDIAALDGYASFVDPLRGHGAFPAAPENTAAAIVQTLDSMNDVDRAKAQFSSAA